jgi:hypothetical protein
MDAIFYTHHPSFIVKKLPSNYVSTLINAHWRAGIGYEFADWGKNQLGAAPGQALGNGILLNHFYTNGIQLIIHYYHV